MKRQKIHAAAFFSDAPPVYRAAFTRARTAAGVARACARVSRDMRAAFPAGLVYRTCADNNAAPPPDFLRAVGRLPVGIAVRVSP